MQAMGILGNIQPRTVRIGVEINPWAGYGIHDTPMRRTVAQIDAVFFIIRDKRIVIGVLLNRPFQRIKDFFS